jgi:hypothetical protein
MRHLIWAASSAQPSKYPPRTAGTQPPVKTATKPLQLISLLPLLVIFLLQPLLTLLLIFPGPPSAATEPAGKTPKGRRAWMHVVFCRDMDVASENSRWRSEPVAQRRA